MTNPRLSYFKIRLSRARRTLEEVASEREVLYPESEREAPPVIHVPGNLARVTGLQEETTESVEQLKVRGGRQKHGATVRYLLRDALLLDGDLYCGGLRLPVRPGTSPRTALTRVSEELGAAALAQTYNGSRYFGHWLLDDRPTQLLGQRWAQPVAAPLPLTQQQREYLDLFEQRELRRAGATLIRELHVFDDIGQNPHRRGRIQELRRRFFSLGRREGQVVFICRGQGGVQRLLLNEDYIANKLEARGAVVVRRPEIMPVAELGALIAGASLVVGLDSSALAHAILGIGEGGALIVISPANRFNNTFKDWCDPLGIRYGVCVASQKEHGYVVSERELMDTMELVLAARAAA
jgi:hypothetical protein